MKNVIKKRNDLKQQVVENDAKILRLQQENVQLQAKVETLQAQLRSKDEFLNKSGF